MIERKVSDGSHLPNAPGLLTIGRRGLGQHSTSHFDTARSFCMNPNWATYAKTLSKDGALLIVDCELVA